MDENKFQSNAIEHRSRKRSKFFYIFIAGIFLIVSIFIGWQFFGMKGEKDTSGEKSAVANSQEPTNTPIPKEEDSLSPTPSPTEAPESYDSKSKLDRADLTVEIQNGSGAEGAAGRASDLLEELGYDVVEVGNADNFDYEETYIKVKSSKKSYLSLLEKDLGDDYSIGNATDDLSSSNDSDALVIIVE